MEPQDEERSAASRRGEERLVREKRIGLIAQLIIHLIGVALLVYAFVVYRELAARLVKRTPQIAFLPIALAFGFLYFALRAVAVYRQLRRLR